MQIVSHRLGRAGGEQALNSIPGIWTREYDGAPSRSVCHLQNPDGPTSSNGGGSSRIDAGQISGSRSKQGASA